MRTGRDLVNEQSAVVVEEEFDADKPHNVEAADNRTGNFAGGLAVFDAPEPWGPWTTVYYTNRWDVGPGESASFPSKWISADGRTLHLIFSGEDCFSVRRATLKPASTPRAP